LKIVEVESGQVLRTIECDEDGFTTFCLSPDDSQIVTSSNRSFLLKRWDVATGKEVASWRGHDMPVLDMAYNWTGTLLTTASADRTVRVWNPTKMYCSHVFRGHNSIATRVYFNPNPEKLVRTLRLTPHHTAPHSHRTTTLKTTNHVAPTRYSYARL
jgi:U3 small nucleolar RNA-associated protein 13